MGMLAEALNEPLSTARVVAYFVALADLPFEDVQRGIRKVAQRQKIGFPRPIEIRSAALGDVEEAADLAWGAVVQAVRRFGAWGVTRKELTADGGIRWRQEPPSFEDMHIMVAVDNVAGSWSRFCELMPGSAGELVGFAKQFKRVYSVLKCREQFDAPARRVLQQLDHGAVTRRLAEIAQAKSLPAASDDRVFQELPRIERFRARLRMVGGEK
jgi:hypothetical protein